eukprot:CAMPEP_0184500568 /NCGR_PEP_ID=MMETSP0113_2-20130426/45212_1 /TAXON_ID=91329 /ORGANISM="Norrisiella sphaerica, Strain BC52" /LENGTH=373 /DNA_ID=CAMNT_0026888989 /DNA_START=261 /DNA_END=1385 /DNA_ORIENTATION=-
MAAVLRSRVSETKSEIDDSGRSSGGDSSIPKLNLLTIGPNNTATPCGTPSKLQHHALLPGSPGILNRDVSIPSPTPSPRNPNLEGDGMKDIWDKKYLSRSSRDSPRDSPRNSRRGSVRNPQARVNTERQGTQTVEHATRDSERTETGQMTPHYSKSKDDAPKSALPRTDPTQSHRVHSRIDLKGRPVGNGGNAHVHREGSETKVAPVAPARLSPRNPNRKLQKAKVFEGNEQSGSGRNVTASRPISTVKVSGSARGQETKETNCAEARSGVLSRSADPLKNIVDLKPDKMSERCKNIIFSARILMNFAAAYRDCLLIGLCSQFFCRLIIAITEILSIDSFGINVTVSSLIQATLYVTIALGLLKIPIPSEDRG